MTPVDRARYLLVTGFGLGLAPVAPGTFGTLAGVVPAVVMSVCLDGSTLLLWLWGSASFLLGLGCLQSGFSQRVFGRADPGAFVLDEMVGYLVTVAVYTSVQGDVSPTAHGVAFLAFRAFDVLKPPPVDRLEELPGALGIMMDDVGAGVYAGVCVVVLAAFGLL
jgi:phosphatidylglycerophosphatase A